MVIDGLHVALCDQRTGAAAVETRCYIVLVQDVFWLVGLTPMFWLFFVYLHILYSVCSQPYPKNDVTTSNEFLPLTC